MKSGSERSGVEFWSRCFARASEAVGGTVERFLAIGPCRVRLRFAGASLVGTLLPALLPRVVSQLGGEPHLTIHLWDSASTGVTGSPPDGGNVERRVVDTGEKLICRHEPLTGVIRVLWPAGNEGWWQVPDAGDLHYYVRAAPLRELLHAALRRAEAALLHAGAVGFPDRGVLLVGPGGSGKSTATLACLESSLGFVSEDYTVLTTDPVPTAFALYDSAKLNDDSLAWLPALRDHVVNPLRGTGEKNLVHLHRANPARLIGSSSLKAVLVVGRSAGPDTELRPVSRGAALRAVAPSTLIQLRSSGAPELKQLAAMIQALPCHRLLTGRNLRSIPQTIEALLGAP